MRTFFSVTISLILCLLSFSASAHLVRFGNFGENRLAKTIQEIDSDESWLMIRDSTVHPEIAEVLLDQLEKETSITSLSLLEVYLDDSAICALARQLACNKKLRHLQIRSRISDHGAIALARALETNSTLERLDLSTNNIGDRGAIAIANALKDNHTLKKLIMRDNSFGRSALEAFLDMSNENTTLYELSLMMGWNVGPHKEIIGKIYDNLRRGLNESTTLDL